MQQDVIHLRRALRLAARGRYRTSPNPMVGAVLVRDGEIVGEGFHTVVGGPHAEAEALASAAGTSTTGATLYVTLEPCNHHGRTPPCSELVVASGVRRVVACHRDPDPRVAGGGFARLRAAGIEVEEGLLAEEAVRLNWRFLTAMVERRPAVTLKWAMSMDGRIATASGESQWISSPGGRDWGLDAREEHDAILIGSGTMMADDPRLDRRRGRADGTILRVVLDRRLRTPPTARLWDRPGDVVIYTEPTVAKGLQSPVPLAERRRALVDRGAEVVELECVEPAAVLADLYQRRVQSVLVEGGGTVASAFVEAGLFDRVIVDMAPMLIGGAEALGPLGGAGIRKLNDAPRLAALKFGHRGGDLVIEGFRERCLPDLCAAVAA